MPEEYEFAGTKDGVLAPGKHEMTAYVDGDEVCGLVEFDEHGWIDGTFHDLRHPRDLQGPNPQRVRYPDSERLNDIEIRLRNGMPGLLKSVHIAHDLQGARFAARAALLGEATWTEDTSSFNHLRMQADGLSSLMPSGPLNGFISPGMFNQNLPLEEISVQVRDEERVARWAADGVEIEASWAITVHGSDPYHFSVECRPYLTVRSETPLTWEVWLDHWISPLADLAGFSAGVPAHPVAVRLSNAPTNPDYPVHLRASVELYGSNLKHVEFAARQERWPKPPIMQLDRERCAVTLVSRWRELVHGNPGFFGAYRAEVQDRAAEPSSRLVLMTAAVEALHTDEFGRSRVDEEEHRGRCEEVVARLESEDSPLSEEDREFIGRYLSRSDDIPLHNRIGRFRKLSPKAMKDSEHLDSGFADRAAELRNKAAHGATVDRAEAIHAARLLRFLIEAQLLRLLEEPEDGLVEIFRDYFGPGLWR